MSEQHNPPRGQRLLGRELTDGVVHRSDLIDRGWRPDAIRRATDREGLEVVRRAWIVAPTANEPRRAAARAGGRVTCVSAAAMLGLWRPGHDETIHLALSPHSGVKTDGVNHRSLEVVPARGRSLDDPIENVLANVATCLAHEDALAVWESALNHRLVTGEHLRAVEWSGPRARRLSEEAGRLSDSGLETLVVSRLRRIGVVVRQQVVIIGRPVDGLVGDRLVLQIDGFAHHSDAAQRRSDIAHDRALRLQGYTVLRFDYHEVVNCWPKVEAEILRAIAQRLHLAA